MEIVASFWAGGHVTVIDRPEEVIWNSSAERVFSPHNMMCSTLKTQTPDVEIASKSEVSVKEWLTNAFQNNDTACCVVRKNRYEFIAAK